MVCPHGARIGAWILFAALLAACSSSSSTVVPPASTIAVHVDGTLLGSGDVAVATATQGSYVGPFTYTSSNGKVLALSLTRPTRRSRTSASLVTQNGTVYIVATGPGVASVTVSGHAGATATPAELQNVRIGEPSPITIAPNALNFSSTGSDHARNVTVSQAGNAGAFALRDTCSSIAKVERKSASGSAFVVTPVGNGSCFARFFGKDRQSADLPIDVFSVGKVVVSPSKLSFKSHASQKVKVTQSGYSGSFSESDACAAVADVVPVTNAGGTAKYTVSPIASGTCSMTFTGGNREKATLSVSVASSKVVVSPSSVHLQNTDTSTGISVTQAGYSGTFAESDGCSGVATVAESTNGSGRATYAVTAVADGSCTATFAGGFGESGVLAVTVALHGTVAVTPSSLQFTATGSAHAQKVTVSQSGYSGSFTEINNCAGVATIVATSKGSYTVTPVGDGACTAHFTGGSARTADLSVVVETPGAIVASPAPLNFKATGPGHAVDVTVTQAKYHGSFTERNTCAGIANVAASSNGQGKAIYSVTPIGGGICDATFTGGNAHTFVLGITVELAGPVTVSPSSLHFTSTGSGSAQNVTVSQTGYSGPFEETDSCTGIATVVPANATGGTFRVTPLANGDCTALFTGGNAQSATLTIGVLEPGSVVASPAPLNFLATGNSHKVVVTVTQPLYGGSFTEHDTCSGKATIAVVTNAGGTATYDVTPISTGICNATFTGGSSKTFDLGITVTETGFGIQ